MVKQSKGIDFAVSLAAATITILGLQMILVLPIYLIDVSFLDYGIWSSMRLWKAVLMLIFGMVLTVVGGEIYHSVENPFDEQMEVKNGSGK